MLNIFIVKLIEFQSLKCNFCNLFLFLNGVLIFLLNALIIHYFTFELDFC